ncbi:MAG: glycosyltransferase family 2 protein [Actinobacteria bacterium]|nr:glycosyltransferase family 2 protein [Actinomycetota bacterium]
MKEISYTPEMISLLIPTRDRPDNVRRAINSVKNTASRPNLVEILFYVDLDDHTFPIDVLEKNIRLVRGPRMWLSVLQNILYANASGEIIMYTGDDVVYETQGWDEKVRDMINSERDKLVLVYGNDSATHGENIAIHGFLHRNWVEATGTWVAPGRGVPYDLWHTEVARKLGRLRYLNDVKFSHIHYRQGQGLAEFDETYKYVSAATTSWVPIKTYKKVERERRIDRVLLTEIMDPKPKVEKNYMLGEFLAANKNRFGMQSVDSRRLRTLNNWEVIPLLAKNIMKVLIGKRRR